MSLPRLLFSRLARYRTLTTPNPTPARNFSTTKKNRSGVDGWTYRDNYDDHQFAKADIMLVNLIGGCAWWWVLYHLWHEPEMLYGEFPWVEPSTWTDEELGIPPDDYEE